MKATELLSHITNNLNTGKPAAHDLVMASNGEPADSYKLNFDNPEIYQVRQYPEFIRKGDDIMYSQGVPGMPPVPFGVDYQKLNRLIYERVGRDYEVLFQIVKSIAVRYEDGWFLSTDERNSYPELNDVGGFENAPCKVRIPAVGSPVMPYRAFYSEVELNKFAIGLLEDLMDSPDSTRTYIEKIYAGVIKL